MKKWILCLLFLLVIMEAVFSIWMADLKEVTGYPMLDMTYYNAEIFYDMVDAYGQEGLSIYDRMQILDTVFPMVYGSLLFLILKSLGSPRTYLPVLGMTFDYLENMSNFILIRWPVEGLPTWTFGFTALKFLFLAVSVGVILIRWTQKKLAGE